MYVAKCWDELWVEEKFQSNTEIAGSPRNVFRYSLECSVIEVELLVGCGGFIAYQVLSNSECYNMFLRSEGRGAKVTVREGNNPDHLLRSQNMC